MAQQNKHEIVLDNIEKSILSRNLKPGDKLPTERELQAKYNIGRGSVREALISLQQKGLIEIKKGSKGGAYVKEIDAEQVSDHLALLFRHGRISMKHLAEFREVVEVVTAAYAVERASAEDIRAMRNLLKEGRQWMDSGENNVSEFYQWELGMHKELARISCNPIFQWISGTLYRSMEPISFHTNKFRAEHFEILADWEDMIGGLERGEVMNVTSIMRAHVVKYRRIVEEELDSMPVD